jgi:hypothetical protein
MCLFWGVIPLSDVTVDGSGTTINAVTQWGCANDVLASGDYVVLIAGLGLHVGSHNQVIVHRVE